ncbi:MAG: hypothetical protein OES09_13955 [Gammaproteobacteria bacterium]|nr:hypothetical protein [Gammaproteobacteria bacterium]
MVLNSAKIIAVLAACLCSVANAVDLHRLWEDRCAECHGEAGDFARRFLNVTDDALVGRHADRDLRQFMQNHYLKNNEIDAVLAMLYAQTTSGARFRKQCSGCHNKAAQLVRESVERRNGELFGRSSGRPLADYLPRHGGLQQDDVAFYLDLLNRIAREVHRP